MSIDHIDGLFFGIPLQNLYSLKRKEHQKEWVTVKSILDKYYKENSPEIEKVIDALLRLMELEIFPNKVKEEEIKAFFQSLNEVDSKFGKINKLIDTLPKAAKKDLYLSYSEDLINSLKKRVIPAIRNEIRRKDAWNENDPLILPYLNRLFALIINLRNEIMTSKEPKIDSITKISSFMIGFYSTVLYGYLNGKLIPEVTSMRYAELILAIGPPNVRASVNVQNLLDEITSIPIVN